MNNNTHLFCFLNLKVTVTKEKKSKTQVFDHYNLSCHSPRKANFRKKLIPVMKAISIWSNCVLTCLESTTKAPRLIREFLCLLMPATSTPRQASSTITTRYFNISASNAVHAKIGIINS
jgi:hypothetical protein